MKTMRMAIAIAVVVAAAWGQVLPDEEIRKILAERVDGRKSSVGIVVGIVDAKGSRVVAYGKTSKAEGAPAVNGDTLFEIGSVTKVFTGQLLAEAVARGGVKLDDPVEKLLPSTVKMPERSGKKITLVDLSQHRSGLPRLPGNLAPPDMMNPYAAYTVEAMYEFLSGYELPRDPGAEFEYSNLGVGLLGHALMREAKAESYEALVRARVLGPLGMTSTFITLDEARRARMSKGHNQALAEVKYWDLSSIAGAGALRSSVNDMLKFVAAQAGLTKTELGPVMARMREGRRPAIGGMEIGLGWMIAKKEAGSGELVWHNGGTGGFQTFVGFDPEAKVGVVVWSNAQVPPGIDDIGRHLLDPASPLVPPKKERKEITLDPKKFEPMVGRYELAKGFVLKVTLEDGRFMTQATGQGKIEIFPMSERVFFPKVVDAELEFAVEGEKATQVTLRQGGGTMVGKRLEGPEPVAVERKAIVVDEKVLAGYVGKYQLAPGFVLEITREGGRLFAQATGQARVEIFAESPVKFFYRVVDAQITFGEGRLTLHQGGNNMEAKRMGE